MCEINKPRNRIARLRNERGLTLQQVANAVNVGNNTISRYETGKREPKITMWIKLANFFGVSVPYLQGLTDRKNNVSVEFDNLMKNVGLPTTQQLTEKENKQRLNLFTDFYKKYLDKQSYSEKEIKMMVDEVRKLNVNNASFDALNYVLIEFPLLVSAVQKPAADDQTEDSIAKIVDTLSAWHNHYNSDKK